MRFFQEIIRLGKEYGGYSNIPGNPGFNDGNLWNRLFEILGSQTNFVNFVVAHTDINAVKGRVSTVFVTFPLKLKLIYILHQLMGLNDVASLIKNKLEMRLSTREGTDRLLKLIRATLALPEYMEMEDGTRSDVEEGPNTKTKLSNIINGIVRQLIDAEILYEAHYHERVSIAQFFVEWLKDFYTQVEQKARDWLTDVLVEMARSYENDISEYGDNVRNRVEFLQKVFKSLGFRILTDWDIPLLKDDSEQGDDPMDEDEG